MTEAQLKTAAFEYCRLKGLNPLKPTGFFIRDSKKDPAWRYEQLVWHTITEDLKKQHLLNQALEFALK